MVGDMDPAIDTTQINIQSQGNTKNFIKRIMLFKYYSSVYMLML